MHAKQLSATPSKEVARWPVLPVRDQALATGLVFPPALQIGGKSVSRPEQAVISHKMTQRQGQDAIISTLCHADSVPPAQRRRQRRPVGGKTFSEPKLKWHGQWWLAHTSIPKKRPGRSTLTGPDASWQSCLGPCPVHCLKNPQASLLGLSGPRRNSGGAPRRSSSGRGLANGRWQFGEEAMGAEGAMTSRIDKHNSRTDRSTGRSRNGNPPSTVCCCNGHSLH